MDNVIEITSKIRALANDADAGGGLARICIKLREEVAHYDWVGFYLAYPKRHLLVLGPFEGEPTEHVRIPYGTGICGQAATSGQAHWVDDVTGENNYLSCSVRTKAEVVIPLFHDSKFVGELDIDSHVSAPFSERDRQLLEAVAEIAAPLVAHLAHDLSP
jgi:L-methionine (R)-S-oxide reductase